MKITDEIKYDLGNFCDEIESASSLVDDAETLLQEDPPDVDGALRKLSEIRGIFK